MPKIGDIIETTINRFDGGMKNDPRDPSENTCRVVTNFDILTNPKKMTPYRSSVSGDSSASTSQKQNFCMALRTGTTYSLYALGVVSGTTRAEIMYKNLTSGSGDDLADATWANTANNSSTSADTVNFNLFVYYQKTGRIYGAHDGVSLFSYDPAGTVAFNETELSVTYTNIAQGLVHPKDDILYIPYDNKIAKNDGGAWTLTTITSIPSSHYITSICAYGLYTAIAIAPLSNVGSSYVIIWNQLLNQVVDIIDWGEGRLLVLEELEGYLIGISASYNIVTTGPLVRHNERLLIKYFSDSVGSTQPTRGVIKIEEFTATVSTTNDYFIAKQKVNNRVYFMTDFSLNSSAKEGVFSVGRSSQNDPFAVVFERTVNNDTALLTGSLKNFFIAGDFMFISYVNSAGNFALSKTDSTATYSHNSIYESKKFNGDVPLLTKELIGVTAITEYLPSGASAAMAYKVDAETVFTRILLSDTDNAISKSAVGVEDITAGGDTVTMTIASPCVVTLTAHGLVAGQRIIFSTTGALPTGITAGTTYYVTSTVANITANTFRISATVGGADINTSGSQSGTHTLTRAFPLPKGYKEIEFQLISQGGAEITGFSFKEKIVGNRPY